MFVEIFFHFLSGVLVVCLRYSWGPQKSQKSLHLLLWHVVSIELSSDIGGHESGLSSLSTIVEEVRRVQNRPMKGGVVAETERC